MMASSKNEDDTTTKETWDDNAAAANNKDDTSGKVDEPPTGSKSVAVAGKGAAATAAGSFKTMLLVLMVAQNSALALVGRYTRSSVDNKADLYVVNHIIIVCECVKFVLASILEYQTTNGQLIKSIQDNIINNPLDFLKILVPSLLYLVQNSLLFVALSNLPAPIYQVTYQGKLLTTAFVSVLMLNRRYITKQWICLLTLGVGVAVVVLGESNYKKRQAALATTGEDAKEEDSNKPTQSMAVGLIAVTIACFCSAFAGVYTEKLLKKPSGDSTKQPVSLWMRNVQMAIFSIIIALIQYATLTGDDASKEFMHGFTPLVYCLVLIQAAGGLLVAAVMKYADNVLKGLATGVSVVVATAVSIMLFGTPLTTEFTFGASIVLGSVYFFSNDLPKIFSGTTKQSDGIDKVEMQPLTSPSTK